MATSATSQTIHAPMYQRVVMRLLMRGLLGPPNNGFLLDERGHARRYLQQREMAGAEGFEPSALGFGDRCSDQTELRPYAPTEFYPTPSEPTASIDPWPAPTFL